MPHDTHGWGPQHFDHLLSYLIAHTEQGDVDRRDRTRAVLLALWLNDREYTDRIAKGVIDFVNEIRALVDANDPGLRDALAEGVVMFDRALSGDAPQEASGA